jgi:hypothetical protein
VYATADSLYLSATAADRVWRNPRFKTSSARIFIGSDR